MPRILQPIEHWFRTYHRDLYFFDFKNDPLGADKDALREWFRVNLPDVKLSEYAPSEYLNYICCSTIYLVANFSEKQLSLFCELMEDENGKSKDERWQLYQMPYQKWHINLQNRTLLKLPTSDVSLARGIWFYTSVGFFIFEDEDVVERLSYGDGVYIINKKYTDVVEYMNGSYKIDNIKNNIDIKIHHDKDFKFEDGHELRSKIQKAFSLGDTIRINFTIDD